MTLNSGLALLQD